MKVAVVGAGATGLAASYLLARAGCDVSLLEADSKVGGLLSTFEVADGIRLEYFYHHFFTHDAELHWLLRELGLTGKIVYRSTTMGLFRDGRAFNFNGLSDLLQFRAIPFSARVRFGVTSAMLAYLLRYADDEATPALAWLQRWAGNSATEAIWRPLLEIKFGSAADRVPLAWIAGRLRQRVRSRSRTRESLGYLSGSLQVLVDRLVEELQSRGVEIRLGTAVKRLQVDATGAVCGVTTSNGDISADHVLVTVPTSIAADWVDHLDAGYARDLKRIGYMGAICTILNFEQPLSSTYWLNVADRGFDFGGVIEQTNLVPAAHYGGRHLVYLSRYVEWSHPLWYMSDEELVDRQLDQLERMFRRNLRDTLRRHWVFRARYAAPLPEIGFHCRIPSFVSPLTNLFLASMPHVYPDERSVNNSVRVAADVVSAMGFDTSCVPRHTSLAGKYGVARLVA